MKSRLIIILFLSYFSLSAESDTLLLKDFLEKEQAFDEFSKINAIDSFLIDSFLFMDETKKNNHGLKY
ncbi:MAG: hypothetical protein ACPG5P_09630, partial [Saprospiraceae bacterium]